MLPCFFCEHNSSFIANRGCDELRERFGITDFERIALNPNLDFLNNITMLFIKKKNYFTCYKLFAILFFSTRCIIMQRIEVQ